MKVPTNLSHYPIIAVDDYDTMDGIHAENETDARAISIGVAQYDKSKDWEHRDISAKVFRKTGGRWSRQSEELPLHRTFDLGTLTLKALLMCSEIEIPQTDKINPRVVDGEYKERIKEFYIAHRSDILPKIVELQQVLNYFMEHESEIK